ncbi:STAS domain-containing protein [Pontibacillus marinus]|uniref:STAS domain-containing protein n=1 Tax=Pontibacillus marinus BH030004 = DSM 16465 TaxID=1385511 RepID=A0A0A5FUD5_9BACI|nr:STAS domain-containing protein [Pontibacillus marinus]KGX84391.1 hypothetical protein N783_17575 [Pontibacillus marinus BH030004 = DSM 16465]
MRQVHDQLPVPFVTIDRKFYILEYTPEASELLNLNPSFLESVDQDSHDKVIKWVNPDAGKVNIEINMHKESEVFLIDLYVHWKNDLQAEVIMMPKYEANNHVSGMLEKLQKRLNDTNFELLEEKDKLEAAVDQNNRLSAPYIRLTTDTALIPLFGDLDERKLFAIKDQVLEEAHHYNHDRILFDFTGVGAFNPESLHLLRDIFKSLFYMGKEVVIIGIKPDQARKLNEMSIQMNLKYMHSLQKAIEKYCS